MAGTKRIPIETAEIELAALLKWAQVSSSGGDAKRIIQAGRVRVNGEVERRRGRKLVPGDHVDVNGDTIVVADASHAPPSAQLP